MGHLSSCTSSHSPRTHLPKGSNYTNLGKCITCVSQASNTPESDYWTMFEPICGARKDTGSNATTAKSAAGTNAVPVLLPAVAGLAIAAVVF